MAIPTLSVLYITTKDRAEARRISKMLLEEKLVACANILPEIESIYFWEGKETVAAETPVLLKTTRAKAERTMQRIQSLHGYENPCILELPVQSAAHLFAQWIGESVR